VRLVAAGILVSERSTFEEFQQTTAVAQKEESSGLWLTLAKRFVEGGSGA
jgi:hypothetical protein